MKHLRPVIGILLLFALLLSVFPAVPVLGAEGIDRPEAMSQNARAVSVSSVSVPSYTGGTSSGWMTYDCGSNLSRGDTGTQSKMRIVKNTTATQFNTYVTTLKNQGYKTLYEKKVPAQSNYNIHHKFLSPDGSYALYTYFVDAYKETRIIVDTNRDTLRTYDYKSMGMGSGNGRTEVYMIPISASPDGFYYDSNYSLYKQNNAGALMVIKMADNSLFVVDGGSYVQVSDRDCERIYAFLRRITDIPEGQKIYINTWFVTHYHDDHVSGFSRLMYKYNTEFELQNVMYNFDVVGHSGDNMQIIGELFPNARYYKQHTGESFKISDVQIDVLYTIEDLYTPNSSNGLVLDNVGSMKKSDEENNCSSVLRVTFDGKTMMITGDIYDSDAIMMGMYPAKDLHVDVLQLPHHAFDNHVTFVKTVAPTISFLHQAESATRNRQTNYNVNKAWMPYAGTIYYGNTETVGYCAEEGIFLREPFHEAVEWLDWGNKTWELDEANPYVSDPVADPEAYYRYTATNALTTSAKAYAIVDDKLGYALGFDAVNGGISNAMPTFRSGDSYYFAASQRRLVNWNMSYSSKGSNANAIVSGATTYYGGLPVNKGSGDYWGTPAKNNGITLGNGDTFQSAGSIYSSWCPFTDQLESKSQWVWMDALSDGRVLLYRRADSTYYPLYRDPGTVTTGSANNTGWGTAKLSKSQINEKRDYFALRLYAYNATADTMLLSWSGHKDYYANPGISKSQVLSLLTADVRVNYSFQTFPGKGEVFYDRPRTADPDAGTYRFEFTGGFSGSTPGDYPVVIKYRNHSGKDLELGTFTVHILDRSSDPAMKSLFIDFNDDAAARKRYQYDPQYAGINLDGSSRWQFIEYNYATGTNDMTQGFVDTLSGNLKLYTKTQDTVSKTLSVRSYVNGYGHLKYDPKDAEVVQIRFKMENLKSAEGQEASFSLWYHKADGSGHVSASEDKHSLGSNFVADGEYMTLTLPLSDAFRNAGTVTGLRPAFFYVVPTDLSQKGCLTIDYLYIGPKDSAPQEKNRSLFFDFTDSTADRERYSAGEQYNNLNFDGADLMYWATAETSTTENLSNDCWIDNQEGSLTVRVAEDMAYNSGNGKYGPWIFTTGVPGVRVDRANRTYHGLGFAPQAGDCIQIRFKLDGCVPATDLQPQLVVCYDRSMEGVSGRGAYSMVVDYDFRNGVYQTLTIPAHEEFAAADCITTIGFRFWHIKAESKDSGTVTIDYIYVGSPEGDMPLSHVVTFADEDGTALYEQAVPTGGTAHYTGATPTKASDSTYHYSFAGWVDGEGKTAVMDNVTEDVTFYAAFTAESHVFQETLLSVPTCSTPGQKECRCNCGYSYTEAVSASEHSPVEIPAVPATCTEPGMSAGAYCEVCKEVLVAPTEIPALGHSAQVIPGRAPTCLNSGLSDGSVCSACHLTLAEQKIIPRLGHDFSIYTDMGQTHTAQCSRCSVNRTQPHSYEDGLCICGRGEAIAPTEDASLKLNHTLNLASGISVNLAVSKSLLEGFDMSTVYVETEIEVYEGNGKTGTKTVKLYPVDQGSYYYFTLEGLTAVNMNDRIRSVLYGTKNGQPYYSPVDDYSIADYAYSQLNKPGAAESLKILCADLLRYGSTAQIFKAYRTDALVDSTMTETHRSYLSDMEGITFGNTNRTLTDLEAPVITWAGKSLDLNSKVVLKFVFSKGTYTGPVEELRLKVRYADFKGLECEQWIGDAEPYGDGGYYAFAFDGLLAAELRSVVSVQVYHGETPLSCTLQYSADTYGNNKTGKLLTLCKALFAYSDSAKTYFAP